MVDKKEISLLLLRVVLGAVLFYFGLSQILSPHLWDQLLPGFLLGFGLGANIIVMVNGGIQILFGLFLLIGILTRTTSLVLAIDLLLFAFFGGFSPTSIREIGLAFAVLMFFFQGPGYYGVSGWRKRKNGFSAPFANPSVETDAVPGKKEGEGGEKPASEAHDLGGAPEQKEEVKPVEKNVNPVEEVEKPSEDEKKEEKPKEESKDVPAGESKPVEGKKKESKEDVSEAKLDDKKKRDDTKIVGTAQSATISSTQKPAETKDSEKKEVGEKKPAKGEVKRMEAKKVAVSEKKPTKGGDKKMEAKKVLEKKVLVKNVVKKKAPVKKKVVEKKSAPKKDEIKKKVVTKEKK